MGMGNGLALDLVTGSLMALFDINIGMSQRSLVNRMGDELTAARDYFLNF
ncbi:hypothetical protein [Levilactobacillus acidifarinae]|nr:hypothetical protein [Levilactobacillus acidifarinae]GEO69085.1 hypothetical protein LAC03_09950 [Levilactobacillus acidifarinae]